MVKKETYTYPPLPDETVTLSHSQYHTLCSMLETINENLKHELTKTKRPKKEYHVECCFYFDQIRGNEIKTFKELLHAVYTSSKTRQPLLKNMKEAG
jgi:hypothetical protein